MVDTTTIRRGGKKYAKHLVRLYVRQLTGQTVDTNGHARAVFYAVGIAALTDIQEAFITKSRGGTDEGGVSWPPLSPAYLAYGRRFGPGEKASSAVASGVMNPGQLSRFNRLVSENIAHLAARVDVAKARKLATDRAWETIRKEERISKIAAYGNRIVDILRDTGRLFNSLTPGYLSGTEYHPTSLDGADQQIFTALADGIVIGTNVIYAASHNYGDDERGIPKREFLPSDPPSVWLDRWGEIAIQAIGMGLQASLKEAG
jgi:phage gpG-like protein